MRANKMHNPEAIAEFETVRRQRSHGRSGRRGAGRGGPPPWLNELFGPEHSGHGRGRGHGGRARRGDVRSAILDVLAGAERDQQPINGYQVIQQITEKSGNSWRPSPGSVYPTIAQLEDEGLIEMVAEPGTRKVVRLTDAGREYVRAQADVLAAVWEPFDEQEDEEGDDPADLKSAIGQAMAAVWQVTKVGTPDQQARAADVFAETRRKLYGILADGPAED